MILSKYIKKNIFTVFGLLIRRELQDLSRQLSVSYPVALRKYKLATRPSADSVADIILYKKNVRDL